MKLYDYPTAPNPWRVRFFIAEKGLTIPSVMVNLVKREQFAPTFRVLNPSCTVPVLETGRWHRDQRGVCHLPLSGGTAAAL